MLPVFGYQMTTERKEEEEETKIPSEEEEEESTLRWKFFLRQSRHCVSFWNYFQCLSFALEMIRGSEN